MKVEKSGKKKQRTEYQTPSLFQHMKFKDKFDVGWFNKQVVNGRYIDLLDIKECGWDIFCSVKKQKWTSFFEVHLPFYPRLVRAFFSTVEVCHNNFTLKATLKGT